MQPIVHPIVGYLCYAAYTRFRHDSPPQSEPTVVAVGAAAIPDLIDQPLWLAGVTPVGRTIAHSLFGAAVLVAVVTYLTRRAGRVDLGVVFGVGYLSHVLADIPWHLLVGDYHELGFLLWPVTEMPAYSGVKTVGTIGEVTVTTLWFEAAIALVGILLWWYDGTPGLDTVSQYLPGR